jgi:hypothetical protein
VYRKPRLVIQPPLMSGARARRILSRTTELLAGLGAPLLLGEQVALRMRSTSRARAE